MVLKYNQNNLPISVADHSLYIIGSMHAGLVYALRVSLHNADIAVKQLRDARRVPSPDELHSTWNVPCDAPLRLQERVLYG